ncbi:leucyl/phenylalanyl-tRNA--protein transferase [Formosa algae]|jgi:leucyl/phenylalanyl-tRNA--protein transferase|uniref:Leucyl/phenylalanyl-tRNA--protein transferase n=1 Tax=Formosa algae TaxID=225843 RepID=A0A9X0YIV4_9FLAO|nr:leucyl/phenylalanyl-tRNA--protein transferase [Formosa algae]MBP1839320.1 leucyl/phenylalanyl-tRNA--protein transferase [Formosa algae]MDQ0334097.1 leucyl/phenylalanyl-tRNA--protein transferase [Formosa algae]OEI79423.1 leucyl/phenylalanyl-tRNA--protein transferase [Formosa algae]PNW29448.1 leucyl/phenylalanyl-tRNA--protein transferase [Formosa algae]
MKFLTHKIEFPSIDEATSEGLIAVGGDLSTDRLLLAYKRGIFPWFEDDKAILWWSPDPRFVLYPEELRVSKSMRQVLRNCKFTVTVNQAFSQVIEACASIKRNGQEGTWITENMTKAYIDLYEMGFAKSVEVWEDGALVGGFYGLDLGNDVFCGESMFSKVSNASKAAFITFVQNTNYKVIDCQIYTYHLESLGARSISRDTYLSYL